MRTGRPWLALLATLGCSGGSGSGPGDPGPQARDTTAELLAALRMSPPPAHGRAVVDSDGAVELRAGGGASLRLDAIPASCLDDDPQGPWFIFVGGPAVALELTVPPRVVSWDAQQGCLTGEVLQHPSEIVGDRDPALTLGLRFDATDGPQARVRSGSLPGFDDLSVRLEIAEGHTRVEIGDSDRPLHTWVRPEGCAAGEGSLQIWAFHQDLIAELSTTCDLGVASSAVAGRETLRRLWIGAGSVTDTPWAPVLGEKIRTFARDDGPDRVRHEELQVEEGRWPGTSGALAYERTVRAEGMEGTVCGEWQDAGTCCRYPATRRDREDTIWSLGDVELLAARSDAEIRASRIGAGCDTWMAEQEGAGALRRVAKWLLGPEPPGLVPVQQAEGACARQAVPGVPLHLPDPAEADGVLASGLVRGPLWVDAGDALRVHGAAAGDTAKVVCVQRSAGLW